MSISAPIRWWLQERKDEITFWSFWRRCTKRWHKEKNNTGRVPRERCHAVPRGGVKKRSARGPRELCRSVPWGVPFPSLLLAPFFARSLTLVPRCLVLNRTETLATQETERGVSLCATAWR